MTSKILKWAALIVLFICGGGCAPTPTMMQVVPVRQAAMPVSLPEGAVLPVSFHLHGNEILLGSIAAEGQIDLTAQYRTCSANVPCFNGLGVRVTPSDSAAQFVAYFLPGAGQPDEKPPAVQYLPLSKTLRHFARGGQPDAVLDAPAAMISIPDNVGVPNSDSGLHLPIRIPLAGDILDGKLVPMPNNHEDYFEVRLEFRDEIVQGEAFEIQAIPAVGFFDSIPRSPCRNAHLIIHQKGGKRLAVFSVVVADPRFVVVDPLPVGSSVTFDGYCGVRTGGTK